MHSSIALAALALGAGVLGQQVGTLTTETHPALSMSRCTTAGCTTESHSVVLDANWRWLHSTSDSTNCYTGNTWDSTLCPDGATCAENCALDGADYEGTYGITSTGDALTMTLKVGSNVGSRVYLLGPKSENYVMFQLKNREFTFDVDVSNLPCGLNGALYFVEMDRDGGLSEYTNNKAGAPYGTGYCDSQCPQDIKFINGEANIAGWTPSTNNANTGTGTNGACCNEMDIWEANTVSAAVTPHVCNKAGQTMCSSNTTCGVGDDRYDGVCDKDGCDFNSYRMGNTSFYGAGKIVDTTSKFTVVTQFITSDGTDTGDLTEIKRIYVQDGVVIQNSKSDIADVSGNSITDTFCKAQKTAFGDTDSFETRGGLAAMGDAFERGMVLVMSIWDDYAAEMRWLDAPYPATAATTKAGVVRGTCGADSGVPATVEADTPGASVTYSDIKVGAIGSTYT
ncbi:hypothetical protein LTR36_005540 [Oleoguttula mirabilis]|uniref:Glucanase n=1 Tax=Oleoguttula mirabilis TaxID=1507867 RepID=A0AAV9JDZ2_9PEZI|nr:hypothetical protein LTR36_005540 [Oleoguttula mirabilis]